MFFQIIFVVAFEFYLKNERFSRKYKRLFHVNAKETNDIMEHKLILFLLQTKICEHNIRMVSCGLHSILA